MSDIPSANSSNFNRLRRTLKVRSQLQAFHQPAEKNPVKAIWLMSAALAAGLAIVPASAKDKDKDRGKHGSPHAEAQGPHRFGDHDRVVVHDYYANAGRSGHCPPGLAKKNNGCLPPGQAKKWALGRPLPPSVVYAQSLRRSSCNWRRHLSAIAMCGSRATF